MALFNLRGDNPFGTAVPFGERFTQISSSLSPKRDCGPKIVETFFAWVGVILIYIQETDHEEPTKLFAGYIFFVRLAGKSGGD